MTPLFLHGAASADMTGWSAVLSALLDGLKDGLLSIPILFLAYLLMELLERSSRLNEGLLRRYSRLAGPALGGLLVLLRTNRNWKENAAVVAILYGFSVLAGIAVTLLAG